MFMATGVIFLICRYCSLNFNIVKNHSILIRLLKWLPLALLLALVFMHMKNGEILLRGMQGIGFTAIAICLFSPFALFQGQQGNHTDA